MSGVDKVVNACREAAAKCVADQSASPALTTQILIALGAFGYKDSWPKLKLSADWIDDIAVADTPEGYDARAVYHKPSKALVLINRGAEGLSSQRDWVEGLKAVMGEVVQPLRDAVTLVGEALAAARDKGLDVEEIVACGHSWGGALSEAQVALGDTDGLPIWGVGFASPGFSDAIRALANVLGQTVDTGRVAGEITHYVRRYDLIPALGSGRIGQTVRVGAVYIEQRPDTGPHAQPKPPVAPTLEAHNCWLYFGYYFVPENRHVLIRLSGAVSVEDGAD